MTDEPEALEIDKVIKKAEKKPLMRNVGSGRAGRKLPSGCSDMEELFAQFYCKHLDPVKAAREAGYTWTDPGNARSQSLGILRRPIVRDRIREIQQIAATRNNLTVDTVVGMILDNFQKAQGAGKFDAANAALKMLGDYLGMTNAQKKEISITTSEEADALDNEIERLSRAAGIQLGVVNGDKK